MPIIKPEHAGQINNVDGRFHNVIADDVRIYNQKWTSERRTIESGDWKGYQIQCFIRFDDKCKNGHSSFSITGEITNASDRRRDDASCCGCIHDEIQKYFPELASLIQWHLVSTDSPMHYTANTLSHAGDKDCWGRRVGEPSSFDKVIRFGNSPVSHVVKSKFWDWLSEAVTTDGFEFVVEKFEHRNHNKPNEYQYEPNYTFAGFGERWADCPFDSLSEADEWLEGLTETQVTFDKIPTAFSKGSSRDFDAARRAAKWPGATDEQLSLPEPELKELLLDRLPKLIAKFKTAMVDTCGFVWSHSESVE